MSAVIQLTPLRRPDGAVVPHVFEDVAGGSEPLFQRSFVNGEPQYLHQSGYGYLSAERVRIVEHPHG